MRLHGWHYLALPYPDGVANTWIFRQDFKE